MKKFLPVLAVTLGLMAGGPLMGMACDKASLEGKDTVKVADHHEAGMAEKSLGDSHDAHHSYDHDDASHHDKHAHADHHEDHGHDAHHDYDHDDATHHDKHAHADHHETHPHSADH